MSLDLLYPLPRIAKICAQIMAGIFALSVVFHLFTMAGLVPASIVMGGNVTNRNELLAAESIALLINMVLLLIVLIYLGRLKIRLRSKTLRYFFWGMFCLFALNTVGNLMARNRLETLIFTPVTLVLAFCALFVALKGFHSTQQTPAN